MAHEAYEKVKVRIYRWRKNNRAKYLAKRKKYDRAYRARVRARKFVSVEQLKATGLSMRDFL